MCTSVRVGASIHGLHPFNAPLTLDYTAHSPQVQDSELDPLILPWPSADTQQVYPPVPCIHLGGVEATSNRTGRTQVRGKFIAHFPPAGQQPCHQALRTRTLAKPAGRHGEIFDTAENSQLYVRETHQQTSQPL